MGWGRAAAFGVAIAATAPSAAQQAPSPWLPLPRQPDTGKPVIDPQLIGRADNEKVYGCTPGLQCRFRLLGVIQNNGAVELRATAFTW
jgi:hypothetical protein